MGIKENFTQAVRELTGIGKEKSADRGGAPVEELRRAVEDDSVQSVREITLDSASAGSPSDLTGTTELDLESMNSTVRPMSRSTTSELNIPPEQFEQPVPVRQETASTPAADSFFAGGGVPVSLFGDRSRSEQPTRVQQPTQQAQIPREDTPDVRPVQQPSPFAQNPFAQTPASQQGGNTYYQQNNYYQSAPQQQSAPPPVSPIPASASFSRHTHSRANEDNELTVISRNTIIDGDIRSFADMSIDGDVKGDVETTKDIDLNGKIIGNITCNNAMMHTAQVQGNVRMKGNIAMKRDTLLMGDLMSTYAEVNGKVKGNLDVVGKADLKGDAVVFGDISASTITVEDGAIIQGYVSTTFLNKEESKNLFPDTVIINDAGAATA
jgi:cytoskeletal protein CcmA (bactofilin family)